VVNLDHVQTEERLLFQYIVAARRWRSSAGLLPGRLRELSSVK
jgi:hypothetical protein